MTTAEKAVADSINSGDKPIVTTDAEGNEFHQRPMDINEKPKPKPKRKGRRVKVVSVYNARMFLTGGDTIDYLEEKSILEKDFKSFGDKVRKLA